MAIPRPILALAVVLASCEPPVGGGAPPPATPRAPEPVEGPAMAFGIGGGEADPQTHVAFTAPRGLTAASVRVVVDRVASTGLNFFAIQVDFDNGTWAHGGLQDVDGPNGTRTRQVNWGGLVDRGGGTDDYTKEADREDLEKIQNAPAGEHVGPFAWQTGVEYELAVERGASIGLPAGDYRLIPDRPLVHVEHARTMWAWRFTARPTSGAGPAYVATLYDTAATFDGFSVWNEAGYGSTADAQHARWSAPRYTTAGAAAQTPTAFTRF